MVFFFLPNTWQWLVVVVVVVSGAMGDSSKEKEECTEQLAGLATCLPYVGGQAKSPTQDCCTGLEQLIKNNKKCLCLIIKDRNDPDIGRLQINITLAISLPHVYNSLSNISKCPELLHMDPKSPAAQIFYQLNNGSTQRYLFSISMPSSSTPPSATTPLTMPAPSPSSSPSAFPSLSSTSSASLSSPTSSFCPSLSIGLPSFEPSTIPAPKHCSVHEHDRVPRIPSFFIISSSQ